MVSFKLSLTPPGFHQWNRSGDSNGMPKVPSGVR